MYNKFIQYTYKHYPLAKLGLNQNYEGADC